MERDYRVVAYILRAAALATFVIGVALLIFPSDLVALVSSGDNASQHFAIYLGTALIGFSVTNWLYSISKDIATVLPAIYGNLASLLLATVIDVFALWFNQMPGIIWLVVLLHLIFTVAFLYCLVYINRHKVV